MELMLSSIIFVLLAILVLQNILHGRERRDLYNRIMAGNLKEYNYSRKREPPKSLNFVRKGIERGYDLPEGGGE